jgi:hypothetical protein
MMLGSSPVLLMIRPMVNPIRDWKKITNTFLRKVSSFYLGNSGNVIGLSAGNLSLRRNSLTITFCSSTSIIFFFYHCRENKRGSKGLFNPKTVTMAYARNFIKSQTFFRDFDTYLQEIFLIRECLIRDEKIKIVIDKCYNILTNSKTNKFSYKTGLSEIQKYLEENSKCKLPWTNIEIVTARSCVKELIEKKL